MNALRTMECDNFALLGGFTFVGKVCSFVSFGTSPFPSNPYPVLPGIVDTGPGPTLKESATSGTADRPFPFKKKSSFTATKTSGKVL